MNKCIYKPLYQNSCDNDATSIDGFCETHQHISCGQHIPYRDPEGKLSYIKCHKKAIAECNLFNGSWPCGQPICEEHFELHSH